MDHPPLERHHDKICEHERQDKRSQALKMKFSIRSFLKHYVRGLKNNSSVHSITRYLLMVVTRHWSVKSESLDLHKVHELQLESLMIGGDSSFPYKSASPLPVLNDIDTDPHFLWQRTL